MNIGVQDGLLDPKHERAMGNAVWLFLWCIRCETQRTGFVLGGSALTYAEISRRSGFAERRVRFWLDRLRRHNYIRVLYTNYKMLRIEIMKPKKWFPKQQHLQFGSQRQNTVSRERQNTVNGNTKNCQSNKSSSMRENCKTSLPSASGGLSTESLLQYHGTWIAVQMRGRKRLPPNNSGAMLDKYYVEWLNSKGFPARIVSQEELSSGGQVN